jgi:hypothetical protein
MYNMDISIFGYKIGLEILILMGIIYLILASHTLCGCCNFYSLIEGMDSGSNMGTMGTGTMGTGTMGTMGTGTMGTMGTGTMGTTIGSGQIKAKVQAKVQQAQNNQAQMTAGTSTTGESFTGNVGTKKTTGKKKEGFTGANINYGESSVYNLNSTPVDTSSWSAQNMTVTAGQPLSAGVKAFMAREPQPVPLPEGEMLMFANTPFKPECCPNAYSTSTGCACMTGNQYNYLITRGSNNVPYSEY